jgi:hypothetical protein
MLNEKLKIVLFRRNIMWVEKIIGDLFVCLGQATSERGFGMINWIGKIENGSKSHAPQVVQCWNL